MLNRFGILAVVLFEERPILETNIFLRIDGIWMNQIFSGINGITSHNFPAG